MRKKEIGVRERRGKRRGGGRGEGGFIEEVWFYERGERWGL